jgi:hypothetical protein
VRAAIIARAVLRAQACERIAAGFERLGVRAVLLKGASLETRVYPRPGMRDMGDVDLLVRPEQVPAAAAALRDGGWHVEPVREVREGPFRNSLWAGSDVPVHLHWHLVNASLPEGMAARGVRMEDVWKEARAGPLGFLRMDPDQEVVYLAHHAVKHSLRPRVHLVDVAWALAAGADVGSASGWARRWRLEFPLYVCLRLIVEAGYAAMPADGAYRSVRGLDGRWFVAAARAQREWDGMSGLAFLSMSGGVAGRMRFLARAFHPPADALQSFGKEPGVRAVLARLRRSLEMWRSRVR